MISVLSMFVILWHLVERVSGQTGGGEVAYCASCESASSGDPEGPGRLRGPHHGVGEPSLL